MISNKFITIFIIICIVISGGIINSIYKINKNIHEMDSNIYKINNNIYEMIKKIEENTVPMQYISADMTITAYTNAKNETNDDNNNTAIMEKPVSGKTCAVSMDYMHWLGGRVYIQGYGVRYVNDLMNRRYKKSLDIYVGKKKEAIEIGKRKNIKVIFLGK